ncbi:tRNA threonylcarbamoyladenosine biosynthesis protein TsaE, partial [Frankliniella fusca]
MSSCLVVISLPPDDNQKKEWLSWLSAVNGSSHFPKNVFICSDHFKISKSELLVKNRPKILPSLPMLASNMSCSQGATTTQVGKVARAATMIQASTIVIETATATKAATTAPSIQAATISLEPVVCPTLSSNQITRTALPMHNVNQSSQCSEEVAILNYEDFTTVIEVNISKQNEDRYYFLFLTHFNYYLSVKRDALAFQCLFVCLVTLHPA